MAAVRARALETRPKLIIAGASAYPREIDFVGFRAIADSFPQSWIACALRPSLGALSVLYREKRTFTARSMSLNVAVALSHLIRICCCMTWIQDPSCSSGASRYWTQPCRQANTNIRRLACRPPRSRHST